MSKRIFDPIHGLIEIDKVCISIIDTLEFQRLRDIKQLSVVHYVFPSATHSRFEHSIGVSYLSGKLLRNIRECQPELGITDMDIQNVTIAGLCHDLGHGPYSHTFDELLKDSNSPNRLHEVRSCIILEYIIKKYSIDINFDNLKKVQDLIHPCGTNSLNKRFMYDIVANNNNGIDVDKLDYLKRDTYYLGLKYNTDYSRILKYARVINDEICYPDKLLFDIVDIFYTRSRLHKQVYCHPVCKSIEYMVKDILLSLFNHLDLCELVNNLEEFVKYSDSIITYVELFDNKIGTQLLHNIKTRKLYKYLGDFDLSESQITDINSRDDIILDELVLGVPNSLLSNDRFFNKSDIDKSFIIDMENAPHICVKFGVDKIYRLYSKTCDTNINFLSNNI